MWALAGLDSLTKEVISSNLSSSDWFVSLTALRLAGEAYGDHHTFPTELKEAGEKLSQSKTEVIAKYAQTLISKGYPNRSSSVYKDKAPQWVKQNAALDKAYASGIKTYGQFCSACHQPHGKGMANIAPSLVKSDWVNGDSKILMGVAVHGLSGPIHINGELAKNIPPIMPGHGFLTDQQLADALSYVRNAWGNKSDQISPDQIKSYREQNADRVAPWTEAELRGEKKPRSYCW